ncbi:serine/threonine protein kinase, partial [bacterium]|nr:serine/threonine protein kinase [bacterium]
MPDDSRLVTCDRCAFPTPSDRSNCQGCGAPLPEHLRTAVPKGEAPRAAGPATRWAGIQGERVEVRAPTRIVRERRFMSAEAPAAPAPPAPASPAPAPPVPGPAPKLPEELVGAVVDGHYRIVAKLGEGGMGVVFDAFDLNLERRVAMKVIQANLRENPSFVERFRREAKIVAQLKHPNLLECYDFGVDETLGALYMILPLLEGTSLDKVLKDGGALAPARAIGIARQMLGALECAHERCIIHRDIKPANIFLEQTANGEQVKLLDFGLAHDEIASMFAKSGAALTNTGTLLGTPAYMSPEQIAVKGITALSDVYAAGCVVYEMLTGRPVFGGESIGDIVAKQLRDAPPVDPLRDQLIPGEIERVVLKALAKKPADRHASARSFCSALEEAARYEPTMSLPPPPAVVAPAAPPSPAPALPRPAPPPSRRVAPPARAIAPSEPAPPQGPLTTGEWVGMLDLAAPAVPAPPPVAPTPRAEPAQTPPRAPLPAAPPPSSGRHPAIELDGRRSPTASGASTQRFSTSEILRVPRVAPTARAPQTGPGARDEDVVAWLSCAPLPPFALGASPVVKIG